ncbi:hypothetical protein [Natronobacterium texcoconense]|uniref:Uncharacterized protein n=1 Tax=Natronobacterium texcoconense TaxID=1095778 RepID=A0A1H1G104_NATTX|nr:hypothetical protein [Natronobacterium texcoconense]SDR06749.1 hypothetical protein SAMN04489842_2202 [Natronobacterium texcoconense]
MCESIKDACWSYIQLQVAWEISDDNTAPEEIETPDVEDLPAPDV